MISEYVPPDPDCLTPGGEADRRLRDLERRLEQIRRRLALTYVVSVLACAGVLLLALWSAR